VLASGSGREILSAAMSHGRRPSRLEAVEVANARLRGVVPGLVITFEVDPTGSPARTPQIRQGKGTAMLKWLLRRQIAAFERAWNYDTGYMREIIEADPRAMMALGKVRGLTRYCKDVPLAAYCAAGLVAVMMEDCGPCTQLGIDMAQREGVDAVILRAIVARDDAAMPEEVALAARFAEASLRHAPQADDLRDEVLRRWGRRGLISLAFAMLSARMYPTLKYALGHGRTCTRLVIGGETAPVPHQPAPDRVRTKTVAA
jgi:hypothetical protein